MTDTERVIAFLMERTAEDEAAAQAATPGPWAALDGGVRDLEEPAAWPVASTESADERADRVHIARHDPARVLADCAAKRAVIAEWRKLSTMDYPLNEAYDEGLEFALACLAQPFAGHPDFDPAWLLGESPGTQP